MVAKGFAATETVESITRAQALAEQLDRPEHLEPLMLAQSTVHLARAEYRLALSLGQQMEGIGEARNDVAGQVFGRLVQGVCYLQLGELVAARARLEAHGDPAHIPGGPSWSTHFDAVWSAHLHAVRLATLGVALALLGYIDQGRSRVGEAVSLARRIRSAPTLAHMLVSAS